MGPETDVDVLTEAIIGCAIEVHRTLGPGLLESIYRECFLVELATAQLAAQDECVVPVLYKGERVRGSLRLDLLVERSVIVEVKAVEVLLPVHLAQVVTYLKLTGFPAGLLINFNAMSVRAGLRRLWHPEHHAPRLKPRE